VAARDLGGDQVGVAGRQPLVLEQELDLEFFDVGDGGDLFFFAIPTILLCAGPPATPDTTPSGTSRPSRLPNMN